MSYTVLLGGPQGKRPAVVKALEEAGLRIHLDPGGAPDLHDHGHAPEGKNYCFITVDSDDINVAYSTAAQLGWRGRAHWLTNNNIQIDDGRGFGFNAPAALITEVADLRRELELLKAAK